MPIPRNSQADQGAYVTGMFLVAHEEAFTHLTLKHPKSPSQKMPKVLQTTKNSRNENNLKTFKKNNGFTMFFLKANKNAALNLNPF